MKNLKFKISILSFIVVLLLSIDGFAQNGMTYKVYQNGKEFYCVAMSYQIDMDSDKGKYFGDELYHYLPLKNGEKIYCTDIKSIIVDRWRSGHGGKTAKVSVHTTYDKVIKGEWKVYRVEGRLSSGRWMSFYSFDRIDINY